jgi:hypothetical protein
MAIEGRFSTTIAVVKDSDTGWNSIRLVGGPAREPGYCNPLEELSEDFLVQELDRRIANVGRQALRLLAFELSRDQCVSVEASIPFGVLSIYEYPFWTIESWQVMAQKAGVFESDSIPKLRYPSIDVWHTLSWPIQFSPFDCKWEFCGEEGMLTEWHGINSDNLDLQVRSRVLSEDELVQAVRRWSFAMHFDAVLVDLTVLDRLSPKGEFVAGLFKAGTSL